MLLLQIRAIKMRYICLGIAACTLVAGVVMFGGILNSPVTAVCGDCRGDIPIKFSERAAARFRHEWRGTGEISTKYSFSIPDAQISIDGVDLQWHGGCLVRLDFPSSGYNTYWDFPTGIRVSNLKRRRFRDQILELIAELEDADSNE